MPGEVDMMPALTVVEMNEKRLTIDIKPPKGKKFKLPEKTTEEEEEEKIEDYDHPSSADIEVVHRHPLPDLHSILKQRTTSESSEEISNGDPDSPRSESEELSSSFSKKRSVSFSSYVDHASFKSSASVSSMTPALKSKRRRQRKREEKKKGRVRCSSEGTSSSEECLNSVSDSYSQSEEEGDPASSSRARGGGRKAQLYRAMSDPGPNAGGLSTIVEGDKGKGQAGKKTKRKNKDSACHTVKQEECLEHVDDKSATTAKVEDGDKIDDSVKEKLLADVEMKVDLVEEDDKVTKLSETKETLSGEEKLDKNKKFISEIREKLNGDNAGKDNEDVDDSDDDGFVDAVSSLNEEFKDKVNCHDTARLIEAMEPRPDADSESKDNDIKASDKSKKSDVETILSWEDGDKENVKECAVHFANSIMFDLDVE